MTPRFVRAWTSERGRVHSSMPRVIVTSDPNEVYALGHLGEADTLLETFDRATGERLRALELARQLSPPFRQYVQPVGEAEVMVMCRSRYGGSRVERMRLHDARAEVVWPLYDDAVCFAVSPDGRWLAVGGAWIRVIDLHTRSEVDRFPSGAVLAPSLVFARDGSKLAWQSLGRGGQGGPEGVWFRDLKEAVSHQVTAGTFFQVSLGFSADGQKLWAAHWGGVACWDLDARAPEPLPHLARVQDLLAVRADGAAVLALVQDRLRVVEVGAEQAAEPSLSDWHRLGCEMSPDGRTVACVLGGTLAVYDLVRDSVTRFHDGHGEAVSAMAWSPDGRRLATTSGDPALRVWDARAGESLYAFEAAPQRSLRRVAWAPDRHTLYSVNDSTLQSWDADSLLEVTPSDVHVYVCGDGLLVNDEGTHAISRTAPYSSPDDIFSLVELAGPSELELDMGSIFHRNPRKVYEYASDEQDLAGYIAFFARAGAEVHLIHATPPTEDAVRTVLDTFSGRVIREEPLGARPPLLRMNACAPDGSLAVLEAIDEGGGYSHELWDFTAGERLYVHDHDRRAMCLYADARRALIGRHGEVEVFDRNGPLCTIALGHHLPSALTLSPDDRTLLVGTNNGQILEYALDG